MNISSRSNLLIIAGTGRNSGKTMLACMITEKFRSRNPVAIKISPHFHEATDGLVNWHINDNFNIYRETSEAGNKDTSRMLRSGARDAFLIQSYDRYVREAFELVYSVIPGDIPVICESPSLGKYTDPAVLLLTDNKELTSRKELKSIIAKADMLFHPLRHEPDLNSLVFRAGRWALI
ncbi:MAG: hypothetical protein KFF49_12315 [Bacteroidales bacterium]|nr:hypothetical protein [Bacteroidales bacterium]